MGLKQKPDARRRAAEFIASAEARFIFLAVGSPQQEMIAHEAGFIDGAAGVADDPHQPRHQLGGEPAVLLVEDEEAAVFFFVEGC